MMRQIWMRGRGEFQALERVCILRVLGGDRHNVGVVQVPGDRRRRDDRQNCLFRLLQNELGLFEAVRRRHRFGGLHELVGHDQRPRGSW